VDVLDVSVQLEIKRSIRWLKKLKVNVKMHGEHNVKIKIIRIKFWLQTT
jgi:hypothetical protein